ncbi:MAG: pantoate--beta-alanine ligase [Candidatus Flexifilum sp.]
MHVIASIPELRSVRKRLSGRVGVVLTMGALHRGHLELIRAARAETDAVLVSIFVNPLQFGAHEDLARYPRDLQRDLDLLAAADVDVVFTPTPEIMYPPGFDTLVTVDTVAQGLEGQARPGHFQGVATVVAKLFNLTQPTISYFGQKDAQQVVVIRRMARDLNFDLEIAVIPTVREPDGLALSSRNVYLDAAQRRAAACLYRGLQAAAQRYAGGERDPEVLRASVRAEIEAEPLAQLEYVAVNDPRTLIGLHTIGDQPLLLSLAVRFGATRLLDNCLLPIDLNTRAGLTATLGAV